MQTETPADEDQSWLAALRTQDTLAFTRLVRTYHSSMLRFAQSLVGDAANDVVQESWLSAFQALPKFEGRSTLKTWLLRITSNQAINHLRANKHLLNLSDLEDDLAGRFDANGRWREPPVPWTQDTPEALLVSDELGDLIERSIKALPPLQGAVLRLREIEAVPAADVCKILEITPSNLYVLLHRARTRVWSVIDGYQRTGNHD